MRSYMEIGPEAVPESRIGAMPYEKTQIGSIVTSLRKGDVFDVLHGLFFVTILGTYLAEKLQNLKLSLHHRMVKTSAPRTVGNAFP
ncbi:hypothetical protein A264_20027 [Pseudomonas syringae pv. actinidiae ICMP 19071]|nr:hypothetical protein A264_20027 [Pseudomonas syringae pv. actinidiae ICMP 19071]